jgi:hypothetical protein
MLNFHMMMTNIILKSLAGDLYCALDHMRGKIRIRYFLFGLIKLYKNYLSETEPGPN